MLSFMRDGGVNMWALLVAAIATVVVAASRPKKDRSTVLLAGTILALVLGLFGMAAGMKAVAANYTRFPEPLAAIAEGLQELANNGVFGGAIALALGVAALVTRPRPMEPAPAAE
jgi:hypothetical protein